MIIMIVKNISFRLAICFMSSQIAGVVVGGLGTVLVQVFLFFLKSPLENLDNFWIWPVLKFCHFLIEWTNIDAYSGRRV